MITSIDANSGKTSFGINILKTQEFKKIAKLAQQQGKQQSFDNAVNMIKSSPIEGDVLVIAGKPGCKTNFKSYSSICLIKPNANIKADRKTSQTNKNRIEVALNHFLEVNDRNSSLFKALFSK